MDERPAPGFPYGFRGLVGQREQLQDPAAFGSGRENGRCLLQLPPGEALAFLAAAAQHFIHNG